MRDDQDDHEEDDEDDRIELPDNLSDILKDALAVIAITIACCLVAGYYRDHYEPETRCVSAVIPMSTYGACNR